MKHQRPSRPCIVDAMRTMYPEAYWTNSFVRYMWVLVVPGAPNNHCVLSENLEKFGEEAFVVEEIKFLAGC